MVTFLSSYSFVLATSLAKKRCKKTHANPWSEYVIILRKCTPVVKSKSPRYPSGKLHMRKIMSSNSVWTFETTRKPLSPTANKEINEPPFHWLEKRTKREICHCDVCYSCHIHQSNTLSTFMGADHWKIQNQTKMYLFVHWFLFCPFIRDCLPQM